MTLYNKKITITGATGGLGTPLLTLLNEAGAIITVIGRVPPSIEVAQFIQADLSEENGLDIAIKAVKSIETDIFIQLAGVQYFGYSENQTPTDTIKLYRLNTLAPVLLTQAILPSMKASNQGHLVFVGSVLAAVNIPFYSTYASSKAAVHSFAQSIRRETAEDNITVTYFAPRAINTQMNSPASVAFNKETKTNVDPPEKVATRLLQSIIDKKNEVTIGFPERLFILINSIFPKIIDKATLSHLKLGKKYL